MDAYLQKNNNSISLQRLLNFISVEVYEGEADTHSS